MKNLLKKILGEKIILFYHYINALLAAVWYGFPSQKMTIVGITGTKGKTSSSEFVWSVLQNGGYKTGLIGTAHVLLGTDEIPNMIHMTMPSPWVTQKLLKKMLSEKCTHVVLEVSSEGLKQYRHIGINYDIAVFTNISPEHLPSHNNSFEAYKKAKRRLFEHVLVSAKKPFFPKKISLINGDSNEASYYKAVAIDETILYSLDTYIKENKIDREKNTLTIENTACHISIPGLFNMYNALVAYHVGRACGVDMVDIQKGIEVVKVIPGRMEEIFDEKLSYRVFIDYAHEKLSMQNLLETLSQMKKNATDKIIILFGAEGGGRDPQKRKDMAVLADTHADTIILSNVDPYNDNPETIIQDIAKYITHKKQDENLFLITDRKEGIRKAFTLADKGDIVCICGKGAEKTMVIDGKTILWDERQIVRDVLKEVLYNSN